MTAPFEVAGHKYQSGTMDVFDQMIVAKRLMPVLKNIVTPDVLGAAMATAAAQDGAKDETTPAAKDGERVKSKKAFKLQPPKPGMEKILPAIADAIYSLSDEDLKTIINKCLAVVSRQNPGGAFSLLCAPNGSLLFQDVTGVQAVQIAWKVVEAHLGDFFSTAL